jgi:predicted ATPase/DNA-binding NarL/FixJ family response regulator
MVDGGLIEAPFGSRHNLPRQLNRFVGREREIDTVRELLGSTRLLTLTGAGGCGKTRLALEVALRALDGYPDGIWLAELAPLTDPGVLAQRLLAVLMVPGVSGRPPQDVLSKHLRDKRALLVLDNCEHIVDACALVAQSLLGECPTLGIVATSREALSIPGEVVWRVPSLRLPDARQGRDVQALSNCEAVALFMDRARAVEPDFALTTRNAQAVAQICTRLDGIPLAIELAAARVRLIPVDQILGRLNDRLGLLTTGSRTALPRQQTLRASIEWSYGLLTEREQMLYRRLSVFAGSFALDAVERVCSGDGIEANAVLDILGRLADKSVLIAEKGDSGLARFLLLETLRQYGVERLIEAGEVESIEARHANYYLALGEAAEAGVHGSAQAAWLERLEEEHDNLHRALTWCLEHDAESALRLAAALSDFWLERGHLSEGRSWLEAVLARATGSPVARARALMVAGNLAYHQAAYAAARSYFEESLAIWRLAADQSGAGRALAAIGMVVQVEGDMDGCRGFLEEGLGLCREAKDADGVGIALFQLGLVAAQQGRVNEAERFGKEALALSRHTGDLIATSRALHNLAVVAYLRRDYATLRTLSEEGLIVSRNLRTPTGIALGLERFAVLAETEHRHEAALMLAGAAAGIRLATSAVISPLWVAAIAQELEPARQALGTDAASAAWTEGTRMTPEGAIGFALASPCEEKGTRKTARQPTDPLALTRREQGIATLVAEGLTNRQIAGKLFISKRTAETHIQHILNKLGVNSRAQIAVWAVRQQLVATSQK